MTKNRRKYDPTRSFRASDELWKKAGERAATEGLSMSRVLLLLLEGYARRLVHPPKVKLVYLPDED